MRNIETLTTKGNTNVRSSSDSDVNGEKIFNSANADVIRDESRWDAFQLMGDTNSEEIHHIANPSENYHDTAESKKHREHFVNQRLRKLGGKVTAVLNFSPR